MTWDDWTGLKHGDRIAFHGSWNPTHEGDIETVVVDKDGEQYIDNGDFLIPLSEFCACDWEIVKEDET